MKLESLKWNSLHTNVPRVIGGVPNFKGKRSGWTHEIHLLGLHVKEILEKMQMLKKQTHQFLHYVGFFIFIF